MKKNKVFKKGQALPLNTIVIAILVVIVLVVIVVSFTGSFGEQSKATKDKGAGSCSIGNGIFGALGYQDAGWTDYGESDCSTKGSGWTRTSEISSQTNTEGETRVCCVKK